MRRSFLFAAMICVVSSSVAAPPVPRLFVTGDSTASSYDPNPKNQQGWGAVLQPFFDERKLQVVDVARAGRSTRTFITEGHWERTIARLSAGDFVVIQFGHNDAGAVNEEPPGSIRPLRARGTIAGTGDESQEIDNVLTGQRETVYSYGAYLRRMIADVRAKGATPIIMTLTKTNAFKDGKVECPLAAYRAWAWQTATLRKTPFVDLTRLIADRYQREGPEKVTAQFIDDTVHTNIAGAEANAADVVSALRADDRLPFRKMLSPRGRAVGADPGPGSTSVCEPLR